MSNASWMYQPASTASEDAAEWVSPSNNAASASGERLNSTAPRDTHSTAPRIRRRNRVIASCLECRRRKLKCDKTAPCSNCARFRRDCLYLAPSLDQHSQQKLADIKERMGTLEKTLERDVAKKPSNKPYVPGAVARGSSMLSEVKDESSEEEAGEADDLGFLEPTPLVGHDTIYQHGDDADDELMDLGVQMGRMRITERVGGMVRPQLVQELNDTLKEVTKDSSSGPSSQTTTTGTQDPREGYGTAQRIRATPKGYLGPGPDYIAPASSFYFPGTNVQTSLLDYLPSRYASDQLMTQYWTSVHYICRCVHRPTFEAQYQTFWDRIAMGTEPTASIQAIVFAAMFSASVSMTGDQALQQFGATKAALMDSLRSGTEMALSKANFLRTTRVDTMQAFVMYLIPLCRAEVSRAHSALTGTAIRLAECMGLHRDGTHYGLSPVETHVRRMVWYQLCFLDLRTAMATGPRPSIRQDEFDTALPLNVDDIDLLKPNPPTEDSPHFTDMTVSLIRMQCPEMNRSLNGDIAAIDRKKKTLQSMLVRIQKFRTKMSDKFLPMLDESIPLHLFARKVLTGYLEGYYIQALHRYLFSTAQRMPDRLRQILLEAGTLHMEAAIDIDTMPMLQPFAWYRGALNQYHSSLLLMIEVYAFPMRKEAPRIWRSLDYIFDVPSHLPPKAKAELILTDLRDRMEQYAQARKVRASVEQEQRIGSMGRQFSLSAVVRLRDAAESGNGKPTPEGEGAELMDMLANQVPVGGQTGPFPPLNFNSPLTPTVPGGVGSGSDGEIAGAGELLGDSAPPGDSQMSGLMEDIDWAQFNEYFSPDTNTGDLNIPDFDYASFTTQGYDYMNPNPSNTNNSNNTTGSYNPSNNVNTSSNTSYAHTAAAFDPFTFSSQPDQHPTYSAASSSTTTYPGSNSNQQQSQNYAEDSGGGGARYDEPLDSQPHQQQQQQRIQQNLAGANFTSTYFTKSGYRED
ncbi:hypothetical protein MBLNU230_g3551t1 [Neophaeotheca triangularis]